MQVVYSEGETKGYRGMTHYLVLRVNPVAAGSGFVNRMEKEGMRCWPWQKRFEVTEEEAFQLSQFSHRARHVGDVISYAMEEEDD